MSSLNRLLILSTLIILVCIYHPEAARAQMGTDHDFTGEGSTIEVERPDPPDREFDRTKPDRPVGTDTVLRGKPEKPDRPIGTDTVLRGKPDKPDKPDRPVGTDTVLRGKPDGTDTVLRPDLSPADQRTLSETYSERKSRLSKSNQSEVPYPRLSSSFNFSTAMDSFNNAREKRLSAQDKLDRATEQLDEAEKYLETIDLQFTTSAAGFIGDVVSAGGKPGLDDVSGLIDNGIKAGVAARPDLAALDVELRKADVEQAKIEVEEARDKEVEAMLEVILTKMDADEKWHQEQQRKP